MSIPEKMLYGITQTPAPGPWWPPYVQYSEDQRVLSPPECKAIIDFMADKELRQGTIGTGGGPRVELDYRSAYIYGLPVKGFEWLYERLIQRISWVNGAQYRFDIAGLAEPIQFLEYRESEGGGAESEQDGGEKSFSGRYKWHTDTGAGVASNRKLSAVIQLSDPSEYEGCRLTLFDCMSPIREVYEIGQGDMVVFPSFTPHCVTPLEKGTRRALALWVTGPTFR